MKSISLVDAATIIYILVDDWWQTHPDVPIQKPCRTLAIGMSEILTILLLYRWYPVSE